ncbi:uncharacterized protein LOC131941332 [Physella acuta]|uniref:uncharacterized protein LOC131941332 n=1 Tax=Physella acuta TaxID=109671 RepID=UPI0027DD4732|nr:uncharacterized protein LOC131941332 [Physella acuta]
MTPLVLLTLTLTAMLVKDTDGQDPCYNAQLGLSSRFCQYCGYGALDSFCIKRYNKCVPTQAYTGYNAVPNSPPPHGYLYSGSATAPPASCTKLIAVSNLIANRAGLTGTTPVYLQTNFWDLRLPMVYFNPALVNYLNIVQPLTHCLANDAPFPNGYWNYRDPRNVKSGLRYDSFYFVDDNGNYTWSFQCYCDFCNSCNSCTNG